MNHKIEPFNTELNEQLRTYYLQWLKTPITRPDGTKKGRAHGLSLWESIPTCAATDILTAVRDPMQNIWIWSDIHFGHTNVIKYNDRPFTDASHMDETLIANHNSKVQPDDICLWVGDVSFRGSEQTKQIVRRLNGYKILIVGNHDIEKKKRLKPMAFDEVHVCYNLVVDGTPIAFTHYPMNNLPDGWLNCHGHIHNNGHRGDEIRSTRHVNVNCEFWDYKPITLCQLIEEFGKVAAK